MGPVGRMNCWAPYYIWVGEHQWEHPQGAHIDSSIEFYVLFLKFPTTIRPLFGRPDNCWNYFQQEFLNMDSISIEKWSNYHCYESDRDAGSRLVIRLISTNACNIDFEVGWRTCHEEGCVNCESRPLCHATNLLKLYHSLQPQFSQQTNPSSLSISFYFETTYTYYILW